MSSQLREKWANLNLEFKMFFFSKKTDAEITNKLPRADYTKQKMFEFTGP